MQKKSSLDYIAIRNHMLEAAIINNNDIRYKAADMNKDGKIGSLDYIAIWKIMLKES